MTLALAVKQLSYSYPHQKQQALMNVTFDLTEGSWTAVVGHNGSGKSTLAKLLDGLLEPATGTIQLFGRELTEDSVWKLREQIGLVFQNPDNQFVGATVEDDIAFGLENRQLSNQEMEQRVELALQQVDMMMYRHTEPELLSGGQKQRVALAGVFAIHPRLIIMDEATSMLDPQGRHEVIQLLRDLQKRYHFTVISITHDPEEMELADEVVCLEQGRLIFKGPLASFYATYSQNASYYDLMPQYEQLRQQLVQNKVPVSTQYVSKKELIVELWTLLSRTSPTSIKKEHH